MKRTLRPIQCLTPELMTVAYKVIIAAHMGKQTAWPVNWVLIS